MIDVLLLRAGPLNDNYLYKNMYMFRVIFFYVNPSNNF